jgi:hypothetical protein
MEVMALSLGWAARQELPTCIYRLDAAGSEMVHGKILKNSGLIYKTLKTAILFPVCPEILEQRAM